MSYNATDFGQELTKVAAGYEGRPAINHLLFSNCQQGPTKPECLKLGMSPLGFDCSGLVLRSIGDVLGLQNESLNPNYRHVRQMGKLALGQLELEQMVPGNIVLFGVEDEADFFKSTVRHAGIIVEPPTDNNLPRMIHANVIRWRKITNSTFGGRNNRTIPIGVVDSQTLAEKAFV